MPLHRTVSDWGPWKSSQDNQYMAQHFHKSQYVGRPKSFVTYSELDLGEDYRNLYRRRSTYESEKYKKSSSFVSDYELPQSGTITPASGFSRSSSANSVFSDASSVSRPKPSRHSYAFEQEQVDNYLAEQIRGRDNPFRKGNPTDKPRQHTFTNEIYAKKHDLIQTSNKKKEYRKGQNYFDHFERDSSLDETSKCLTEVKVRKRKAFLEKQKAEDLTSLKSTFHSNSSRHASSENEQISKRWSLDLSNIDKERKTLFNVFKNDGIVRKTGGGSRMNSFKENSNVPVNSNEVKEIDDGKSIHEVGNSILDKKDVKKENKTNQEDIHELETVRAKDYHTMNYQKRLEKSLTEDSDEYIIAEGPNQYHQSISDTFEASLHDHTGSKKESLHAAEYKGVDAKRKDSQLEVVNDIQIKSNDREHSLLLVNKSDEKMQEDNKKNESVHAAEYKLVDAKLKDSQIEVVNDTQIKSNERELSLLLVNKSNEKMQEDNSNIEDSFINECSVEVSKIINPLIQETPERNHKDANYLIVELFDTIQSMSSTSTDSKSSLLVKRNETSQKEKLHLLTQVIAPGTDNTRISTISHPTSPIVSKIQEIRQFVKAASEPLVQRECAGSDSFNYLKQESSKNKEVVRDGYDGNHVLHIQHHQDISDTFEASVHDHTGSKTESLHAAEYKVVDAKQKDSQIEVVNDIQLNSNDGEHSLLLVNKIDEKMQEDNKKLENSFINRCSVNVKAASELLVKKKDPGSESFNYLKQEISESKKVARDGYDVNQVLHIEQKKDDMEETNGASGIFWADLVQIEESPSSEDENEKVQNAISILRPKTYEKQGLNLRDREANRRKSWMLNTLEEQDRKRRNRHSTPHFLNLL